MEVSDSAGSRIDITYETCSFEVSDPPFKRVISSLPITSVQRR